MEGDQRKQQHGCVASLVCRCVYKELGPPNAKCCCPWLVKSSLHCVEDGKHAPSAQVGPVKWENLVSADHGLQRKFAVSSASLIILFILSLVSTCYMCSNLTLGLDSSIAIASLDLALNAMYPVLIRNSPSSFSIPYRIPGPEDSPPSHPGSSVPMPPSPSPFLFHD